jgi:lipopolysaccharide transport system ATP-binding protein
VHLYVVKEQTEVIFNTEDILVFDVREDSSERRGAWFGKWIGAVRPSLKWETEFLGKEES